MNGAAVMYDGGGGGGNHSLHPDTIQQYNRHYSTSLSSKDPLGSPLKDATKMSKSKGDEEAAEGLHSLGGDHSVGGGGGALACGGLSRTAWLGVCIVAVCLGAVVLVACLVSSAHLVDEGCVAVYFRNGALQAEYGDPGIRWSRPFVTRMEQVKVRPETKFMDPLVCTTRDGVRNIFRDVQVITSVDKEQVIFLVREFGIRMKEILVYERVTEAIQLFCSNNTIDEIYNTKFLEIIPFVEQNLQENLDRFAPDGAIKIWNVFLPKPDVPPAIAANYRDVKVEWTRQLVAQQRQKTETIEKETEKIKALLDAERQKEVDLIEVQKEIQREEGKRNVSSINNAIYSEKMRNEADTMSYVQAQEASSNELLLTDAYVKLEVAKALSNNTKMFFSGEDSVVGGALAQVFGGGWATNKDGG